MPKAFDDMVSAIKSQLKKDNPNLSDKEVEQRAYAIATTQWKKTHGGKNPMESIDEDKFDESGRYIVAENCKFYIEGGISSIEE